MLTIDEIFDDVIEKYKQRTAKKCYKAVKVKNKKPGLKDNKIGGVPYIPKGCTIPKDSNGEYNLNYTLNKKQESRINIGIRFDSEEIATLLVNARTTLNTQLPSYFSGTARLGKRYGAKLAYGIEPSPLTT